jgi:hypothetical protein
VPTSEGAAFAARTGCLFVEASATMAECVTEAFNEVVARIIDTPSMWNEDKPKSSGRTTATANTSAVSGPRRATAESMPGNIDLSQVQDEDTSGGCLCLQCRGYFSLPHPEGSGQAGAFDIRPARVIIIWETLFGILIMLILYYTIVALCDFYNKRLFQGADNLSISHRRPPPPCSTDGALHKPAAVGNLNQPVVPYHPSTESSSLHRSATLTCMSKKNTRCVNN